MTDLIKEAEEFLSEIDTDVERVFHKSIDLVEKLTEALKAKENRISELKTLIVDIDNLVAGCHNCINCNGDSGMATRIAEALKAKDHIADVGKKVEQTQVTKDDISLAHAYLHKLYKKENEKEIDFIALQLKKLYRNRTPDISKVLDSGELVEDVAKAIAENNIVKNESFDIPYAEEFTLEAQAVIKLIKEKINE